MINKLVKHMMVIVCFFGFSHLTVHETEAAKELSEQPYIDFSSDRSTWFFRIDGGKNNVAFFDFFSPFDPTVKVGVYDPLTMYELDHTYYVGQDGALMIHLEDVKKLYAPYFDYEVSEGELHIRHTVYDKLVTAGFGERATTIEYTKKVWELYLNRKADGKMNAGVYDFREYLPVQGGRNKSAINPVDINKERSIENQPFTFSKGAVEIKDGDYYVPLAEVMELMGKVSFQEEGYLTVQAKEMADVTKAVDRSDEDIEVSDVVVPKPSNPWHGGLWEEVEPDYTWADYMNDVADGKRRTGWLWKSFYMASGDGFKDENGNTVTLEANRIVPFSLYIPTNYDANETRLTYMLHGGTGNEHTPTYRLMQHDLPLEQYAEEYNYILLSPNGWTQDPVWRQNQALYSFEQSFEQTLKEFTVDRERVFITGNSLGGRGTLELAARFPDRFRAMAPTAPKITDRAEGGGTVVNIEGTDYDLSAVKHLPAFVVQGTADTTTSFKVQIGSEEKPGSIVSAVMPKLQNAQYITVERGDHTYSYAAVLGAIFDFFEAQLASVPSEKPFETLYLYKNSNSARLDEEKTKLAFPVHTVDETTMISIQDLESLYESRLNVYPVHLYDSDPKGPADYWTIISNGQTLNFTVGETAYRRNMERYQEEAKVSGSGAPSDKNELTPAPHFSAAPYEQEGQVYVPAEEVLSSLGLDVQVSEQSVWEKNRVAFLTVGMFLVLLVGAFFWFKRSRHSRMDQEVVEGL